MSNCIPVSPFLTTGHIAPANHLAQIYLKKDLSIPTILRTHDDDDDGYAEGKVVNTRFGSFPHSTLIGLPYGSQVRASKVDTGSRGRRGDGAGGKKRTREDFESVPDTASTADPAKAAENGGGEKVGIEDGVLPEAEAVQAATGFIHLLAPTPENWTSSLPHRTQVVYTPDYSYILQRIRARPGTRLIEAGAGSGSFTHASARAVYNGYPTPSDQTITKRRKLGKVYSYEFHEQRHEKLGKEISDHGLDGIVQVTHRDVCQNGFLLGENMEESPLAEAVFLDLPAPWLALSHLSRHPVPKPKTNGTSSQEPTRPLTPAINPSTPIHICTFSPCIEQVQKTISVLRHLGWVDIEMLEISQKRLDIRRERIGTTSTLDRSSQQTYANVEEALQRLREVEGRARSAHQAHANASLEDGSTRQSRSATRSGQQKPNGRGPKNERVNPNSKAAILKALVEHKVYKQGRLVHRAEPELKTHTSYLVFAVLPMEWSAEDEAKAREKYPVRKREGGEGVVGGGARTGALLDQGMSYGAENRIASAESDAAVDEGEGKGEGETKGDAAVLESIQGNDDTKIMGEANANANSRSEDPPAVPDLAVVGPQGEVPYIEPTNDDAMAIDT